MMATYLGRGIGVAGLRVWWSEVPAAGPPGGDWIDVVCDPDGRVALTIGHAVGQDGQASALAGVLLAVMRTALLAGQDPDEVLASALDEVAALGDVGEMYATAFVALADPVTGRLTYANAGHPVPVPLPGAGPSGSLYATGPILSDLFAGRRLWSTRRIDLAKGDQLLLFTDRSTGTRDADGCRFASEQIGAGRRRFAPGYRVDHGVRGGWRAENTPGIR
jgi:serine phosphatase RsbU (regulator of sigma subunit)